MDDNIKIRKIIKTTLNEWLNENISNEIFYHGTNNKFDLKDIKLPAHFGTKNAAKDIGGKFLLKAKLKLENPLRCYDEEVQEWNIWTIRGTLKKIASNEEIEYFEDKYGEVDGMVKLLQNKGYDSIVYENQYEDIGNDSYIVFYINQIIPIN